MRKKLLISILILLLAMTATGCVDNHSFDSYRPITDLNNLEGRKIGVNLGWAADMLLTGRDDLTLYRYDETADMLMALCYKQLDAVATEDINAVQILACTNGLRQVDGMLTMDGYTGVINEDGEELWEDFNDWIAEYRTTEGYEKWLERLDSFDGVNYEWPCGEWPTEGKKIVVGGYDTDFPMCFAGHGDSVNGYDMELLYQFCVDRGYSPDIMLIPEESIFVGLDNKTIDMLFGDYSTMYEQEAWDAGYYCTDSYREAPIVVIEIEDPDNLEISAISEYEQDDE